MSVIYNRATTTAKSGTYLTKSQADALFVSKSKDSNVTGTLQVLNDIVSGANTTVSGTLSVLGNTVLGNQGTDTVSVVGTATFAGPPAVTTATYGPSDGSRLATKTYVDGLPSRTPLFTSPATFSVTNNSTTPAPVTVNTFHPGPYVAQNQLILTDRNMTSNSTSSVAISNNGDTRRSSIIASGNAVDQASLEIGTWSTVTSKVIVKPTETEVIAGSNAMKMSSSEGLVVSGPMFSQLSSDGIAINAMTTHAGPNTGSRCLSLSDINTANGKSINLAIYGSSDDRQMTILASSDAGYSSGIIDMSSWSASSNGVRITPTSTTVRGSGNSLLVDENGTTFTGAPRLAVYGPPADDLCLVSRKWVSELVAGSITSSTAGKSVKFRQATELFTATWLSRPVFGISPPDLGSTSKVTNTVTNWKSFYLNTKQDFSSLESVTFQLYRIIEGKAAISRSAGQIVCETGASVSSYDTRRMVRTTEFTAADIRDGANKMRSLGTYMVQQYDTAAPTLTQISSSQSLWAANNTPATNVFTFANWTTTQTCTFQGMKFEVAPNVGDINRILVSIGFPSFLNAATNANWITLLGFDVDISQGFDPSGHDGWYVTLT